MSSNNFSHLRRPSPSMQRGSSASLHLRLFQGTKNTAVAPRPGFACFLPSAFSSEDAICAHSGIYTAMAPIVNTACEERREERERRMGERCSADQSEENLAVTRSVRWETGQSQVNGFMWEVRQLLGQGGGRSAGVRWSKWCHPKSMQHLPG